MKEFYGNDLLIGSDSGKELYEKVKALPIIDYHCHLDPRMIAEDGTFSDIGEFWLGGDHYKWRAMRICGVDEYYITGGASYKEKFLKYAEIMPLMAGNPLYYWTHMELRSIFGIELPLNKETAEKIFSEATEKLKGLSCQKLLEMFSVERVATTDDPIDDLRYHGKYGNTLVTPTFRPDKVYSLDSTYINKLSEAADMQINTLSDLLRALEKRLDFFVSKGCFISDHGFDAFPDSYATEEEARDIFGKRGNMTAKEKDAFFGFILTWLMKEYKKRGITAQLHFAVTRNVNPELFAACGPDSGIDVISSSPDPKALIGFLSRLSDNERPDIVLYTLNDSTLTALAAVSGAFRRVRMGAAWWFNDTLCGIKRNIETIAEYSSIGTNLGMLTDSRSFSSYLRFDFFRRIICDFVGGLIDRGEYDKSSGEELVKKICYFNAKEMCEK